MEKIIFDAFNDVYDFRTAITGRPDTGAAMHSARDNDNDFAGMSLDDALETLTKGLPEVVTKLKKEVEKLQVSTAGNLNQRRPINYYNGHCPNVPAAIIGLPKSMRKVVKTPSKVKTVTLFFDACVPWSIEAEDLEKAGFAVYQLVYWLEKCGYRVKLYGIPVCCRSNNTEKEVGLCTILLKDFRQPLDMLKLSFSLTSVAQWRRLGFKWIETAPGMTKGYWTHYGSKLEDEERIEVISKCGYSLNSAYYINFYSARKAKFDPMQLASDLGIDCGQKRG